MDKKKYFQIGVVLFLVCLLTGCSGIGQPTVEKTDEQTNTQIAINVSTTIPTEVPTFDALIGSGELTYEQQQSMTPPFPKNLKVIDKEGGIYITWEPADKVVTPHGYKDEVLYYKVFRRTSSENDASQIGTTKDLFLKDNNVTSGHEYFYSVVEVHAGMDGGEVDGESTDEVAINKL